MTCVRVMHFIRHYKDTIQERLTILMSVCYKYIRVRVCQNCQNRTSFDEVIAKNKMESFLTHSVESYMQCWLATCCSSYIHFYVDSDIFMIFKD